MVAQKVSKKRTRSIGVDLNTLSQLVHGKPLPKPFPEIEDMSRFFDALTEYARKKAGEKDKNGKSGFLGFLNEEMVVVVSKDVTDVITRNAFGYGVVEVLIPYIKGENERDLEARKLFYHTQFRKTQKASLAEIGHSFYAMLPPSGLKNLLEKYSPKKRRKSTRKPTRSEAVKQKGRK